MRNYSSRRKHFSSAVTALSISCSVLGPRRCCFLLAQKMTPDGAAFSLQVPQRCSKDTQKEEIRSLQQGIEGKALQGTHFNRNIVRFLLRLKSERMCRKEAGRDVLYVNAHHTCVFACLCVACIWRRKAEVLDEIFASLHSCFSVQGTEREGMDNLEPPGLGEDPIKYLEWYCHDVLNDIRELERRQNIKAGVRTPSKFCYLPICLCVAGSFGACHFVCSSVCAYVCMCVWVCVRTFLLSSCVLCEIEEDARLRFRMSL